jgi:hypothetical protein
MPAVCWTYMESVKRGETNPTIGSLATIARTLKIPASKLLEGSIRPRSGSGATPAC